MLDYETINKSNNDTLLIEAKTKTKGNVKTKAKTKAKNIKRVKQRVADTSGNIPLNVPNVKNGKIKSDNDS